MSLGGDSVWPGHLQVIFTLACQASYLAKVYKANIFNKSEGLL